MGKPGNAVAPQRKIYSILNDVAFLYVFGREGNEKLTVSLLNALLQLEGDRRIESLVLKNPFNLKRFKADKLSIVDVKAQDKSGKWYNIEAQTYEHAAYVVRTAFYVAKLFGDQARAGEQYAELTSATGVSIVGFDLFPASKRVHEAFAFRNCDNSMVLNDTMALHYIDLTKFDQQKPHSLRTNFEKWLYFMKFSQLYGIMNMKLPATLRQEEAIVMAMAEHQKINADEEMRILLEDREKAEFNLALIKGAERALGRAEGRAEGEKLGMEKGEDRACKNVALRLLEKGLPLEMISEVTGLKPDEISRLRS